MKYPSIQGKRIYPKSKNQFYNLGDAKPGEFWWHEVDISGEVYNRLYFRSPVEEDTNLHGIFVVKSGNHHHLII